jgi:hypothetical protein
MWAAVAVMIAYWYAGQYEVIAWVLVTISVAGASSFLFKVNES